MILNKTVSVMFTLWAAVITYRYGNIVLRSLRSPFNLGRDTEWFAIWLAVAAALIVLAAVTGRGVKIVFSILAAACLLILILSGSFLSGVVAGLVFLLAHLWGKWILGFLGIQDIQSTTVAITIPVGLIVPALSGFVLAALHLLTPLAIVIALVSPLFLIQRARTIARMPWSRSSNGARERLSRLRDSLPFSRRDTALPVLLIAPVILLNLVWAVAPEIQFDALNYHLSLARIYLANSGFIELPYFFHSYFYRLVEMLFTIALALHGPAAAKLLSFGFSLVAACAVFSLGKLVFDERVGLWSAAFFYTTPTVSWLAGTAYIDNAVAAFLTATIVAFVRWQSEKEQTGWLYLSALLAGATVAAKLNGAFGLPVMLAVAVWQLRTRPRTLVICAVLAISVALPWYAVTYIWTGNPVFPLLNGIFKSPLWELESRVVNATDFGVGASPAALLRLPFRLIFETTRFGESLPRGAAGVALLFALPFSVVLLPARKSVKMFLFLIASVWLLLWAFSFQYARYYVHILPVICVLATATVFNFAERRWTAAINRICLAIALVLQFPTTSIQFWNVQERFPTAVALGRETREQFLTRGLDDYNGAQRLNTIVKPGEHVLGVAVEDSRFYLTAPLETLPDATRNSVLIAAASMSGQNLSQTLRQSGFAYIFARRAALLDPPAWYPYLKSEFLATFATVVFRDENAVVYRLND